MNTTANMSIIAILYTISIRVFKYSSSGLSPVKKSVSFLIPSNNSKIAVSISAPTVIPTMINKNRSMAFHPLNDIIQFKSSKNI